MSKVNTNLSDEITKKIIEFCNIELSNLDKISFSKNPNITKAKEDFSATIVRRFIEMFSLNNLDEVKNNNKFDFMEISIICFNLKIEYKLYTQNKRQGFGELIGIKIQDFIKQLRFLINHYNEFELREISKIYFKIDGETMELNLSDSDNITTLFKEIKQQMLNYQNNNEEKFNLLSEAHSKLKDELNEFKKELSIEEISRIKEEIVSSMTAILPLMSYAEKIKNIFSIPSKIKKIKLLDSKVNLK